MQLFLAPECLPFAIAAVMLAALTAIEIACLLLGFSLGEVIDKSGMDDHSAIAGLLSWLNVGGVPVLILIMLFLGFFAITGFILQSLAQALWSPLPAILAVLPAFVLSLPAVRVSSRSIARVVPRDETYAVDLSDFIGRSAEVSVGPLDQGLPGRVRVKDRHGNWHTLRARAGKSEEPIAIGATVLLVDHVSNVYVAIRTPSDILASKNPSSMEQP